MCITVALWITPFIKFLFRQEMLEKEWQKLCLWINRKMPFRGRKWNNCFLFLERVHILNR